jgi:hypothetical protein
MKPLLAKGLILFCSRRPGPHVRRVRAQLDYGDKKIWKQVYFKLTSVGYFENSSFLIAEGTKKLMYPPPEESEIGQ